MNIEMLGIEEIRPYENNAKKHPAKQVNRIAKSIQQFGFQQPIVVDKDGVVVIGHGRLLACKKLGIGKIPCVRAENLSEGQKKALRLADNKCNESEWDEGLLDIELADIVAITVLEGLSIFSGKDIFPIYPLSCLSLFAVSYSKAANS